MNRLSSFPELEIRPVGPDDGERMRRLFGRLSPDTVYRRFFTLFPTPPPSVVEYLATADHHDHDGLVVLDGDEIVAVARWDRPPRGGDEAEVSILVEDAWQHRGLGRALMRRLVADAACHDITAITADVLTENGPARRLAMALARPSGVELDGPVTHFTYSLAS